MFTPVILCGGSGTRLWPASRKAHPKQFVRFADERSTFQNTVERVRGVPGADSPLVVAGSRHLSLIYRQIMDIGASAQVIAEPSARDSGPAIAAAATLLAAQSPDRVMLVLAADHQVNDVEAFHEAASAAVRAAAEGLIVTFGIKPDHPATGYGYIAPGESLGDNLFKVRSFVEKPNIDLAEKYVAGGYLWNSGNFAFRADTFLDELKLYEPEIGRAARAAVAAGHWEDETFCLDAASFNAAPKMSVDYAVMERTGRAAVVPADLGWSDLGTWEAIWATSRLDDNQNSLQGDIATIDTRATLVRSEGVLVTTVGVHDLIVVATGDAVLVCDRSSSQSVRKLVDELERRGRPELSDFLPATHR